MHLRRLGLWLAVLFGCAFAVPVSADTAEHRELGPHVHGHGTLNIAFEGGRVTLDLETPGTDLLGFEHEAKSDAEKAALTDVDAKLKAPLALFKFPSGAGCKVAEAKVDLDDDEAEDAKAGANATASKGAAGHNHADHDHGDHAHGPYATIGGEYELSCASLSAITSIEFDYFKIFPRAQSLTVNVVTPRAQSAFEVTRAKPILDLGKLM